MATGDGRLSSKKCPKLSRMGLPKSWVFSFCLRLLFRCCHTLGLGLPKSLQPHPSQPTTTPSAWPVYIHFGRLQTLALAVMTRPVRLQHGLVSARLRLNTNPSFSPRRGPPCALLCAAHLRPSQPDAQRAPWGWPPSFFCSTT